MTVLDQIHGHTKRFFVQDDLGKSHRARIGPARMRSRNQRRALLLLGGAEIWTIEDVSDMHRSSATRTISLPFNSDMKNGNALVETVYRGEKLHFCV